MLQAFFSSFIPALFMTKFSSFCWDKMSKPISFNKLEKEVYDAKASKWSNTGQISQRHERINTRGLSLAFMFGSSSL